MQVKLLHYTPLWVASKAIRKCWASEDKSDTCTYDASADPDGLEDTYEDGGVIIGPKDKALIERVGNKNKHSSTLEHINYSFDIDGISRACLQELARHRHASLSVKSTRYTLKELKKESSFTSLGCNFSKAEKYIVLIDESYTNTCSIKALEELRQLLIAGISNDKAKYCLPEAYKTSLVLTVNARSLQNFLSLRTDKAALWEIRDLANEIFNRLPDEHKYLFREFVKEYEKEED